MTAPIPPWRWTMLGAVLFAAAAALYIYARPLYSPFLSLWAFTPFRYPFLDSEAYITIRQCFARGIDVYATNPCDVLGRLEVNSPFCLYLFLIPADPGYNSLFAGGIIALYAWATTRLAPVAGLWPNILFALGFFSPPVVFAIERANLDLFIFALATAIILLLERGKIARLLAYALSIFGFLVKFYPIMLILLAVRERPRLTALIAAITAAIIAIYGSVFYHELLRMAPNVPNPGPFGYDFGASLLASGLGSLLRHKIMTVMLPLQILASLGVALKIMRDARLGTALQALTSRETNSLLAGALLLIGCFFTGVSIGYRAIHLLLALPALIRLAAIGRALPPPARPCWRHADFLAITLLWLPVVQLMAKGGAEIPTTPLLAICYFLAWLCREIGWWWLMTLLGAMVLRLFATMQSTAALRQALPWLGRILPGLTANTG
jgi:hypothetical protein